MRAAIGSNRCKAAFGRMTFPAVLASHVNWNCVWHSAVMKALKSDIAKQVLRDPEAAAQLQSWRAARLYACGQADPPADYVVRVTVNGNKVCLRPMAVPKAR